MTPHCDGRAAGKPVLAQPASAAETGEKAQQALAQYPRQPAFLLKDGVAAGLLELDQRNGFSGYLFALGAVMCYGSSYITADGPAGLPERTRRRHRGRGLSRLCGGDVIILADPAQARVLGRHQGYEQ